MHVIDVLWDFICLLMCMERQCQLVPLDFSGTKVLEKPLPYLPPVALGLKMECKGYVEILVSGLESSNPVCQGLALSPFW